MKIDYKKVWNIFVYIIALSLVFYFGNKLKAYDELRDGMYQNFYDFGKSLERMNENIAQVLTLKGSQAIGKEEIIDKKTVTSFHTSVNDARNLGRRKYRDTYYEYCFIYIDAINVLRNVLSDNKITASEEKYLKTLYTYNERLLEEYKEVIGVLYENEWDFDKRTSVKKRIIEIYNSYSKLAEELLLEDQYSFLKSYRGDYEDVDFQQAENYCKEVLGRLVGDKSFKYDNREDVNHNAFEFETFEKEERRPDLFDNDAEYIVAYDKTTKEVKVTVTNYTTFSSTQIYEEAELDKIASDAVGKFDKDVSRYKKEIQYGGQKKIVGITYAYIKKVNGIFDEKSKIEVTVEPHGLVSHFSIIQPDDEEIKEPEIHKEEILKNINDAGKVINLTLIRNVQGEMEYEVQLQYEDTVYAVVFDGESGEIKYFGRNIRVYNFK